MSGFDLSKEFAINTKAEEEGLWEDLGGGAGLLVASIRNERFGKAFDALPEQVRKRAPRHTADQDREVMAPIMAKTLLLDWRGIADEGKEITYSKDNATSYLIKYPRFYELVSKLSQDDSRYLPKGLEDNLKN